MIDLTFQGEDGPVRLHDLCHEKLALIYHFYGW
jgi:hypothetical protein